MPRRKPIAVAVEPSRPGPRILRCHQGTPEWQAERAHRIGGSDANVIALASPYTTPFQLWQIKTGLAPKPEGWALAKGHQLEPIIVERYEALTGRICDPVVMVAANDWQITSLDGRTLDGDRIMEAKQLDLESFEQALAGVVPPKYWPQVQHNLGTSQAAVLDLACYHEGTDRFTVLEVTPDSAYFAELTAREQAFRNLVQGKVPPELTARDVVHREDEAWAAAAMRWAETKRAIEDLEATLEQRRAELIALAGIHNTRGAGALVTFTSRAGNVDWQKLAKDHGLASEVIEAYRKARTPYTLVTAEKAGKEQL